MVEDGRNSIEDGFLSVQTMIAHTYGLEILRGSIFKKNARKALQPTQIVG